MTSTWYPDVENWNDVTEEKAEFIHEQSQLKLDNIVIAAKYLEERALTILKFIPLLLGMGVALCLYYYYTDYFFSAGVIEIVTPTIVAMLLLCIVIMSCTLVVFPRQFYVSGNNPENLLNADACSQDYASLVMTDTIDNHRKIYHNLRLTERNRLRVQRSILIVQILPLVWVGMWFMLSHPEYVVLFTEMMLDAVLYLSDKVAAIGQYLADRLIALGAFFEGIFGSGSS